MNPHPPLAPRLTDNGKLLILFDASAFSHSDCLRDIYFLIFRGLSNESKDFKMEYGTAFHKALAAYYNNGSKEQAIQAAITHYSNPEIVIPEEDFRTLDHLINCLMQYWEFYKGDVVKAVEFNGQKLIEKKFAIPFYQDDICEILLSGTMDIKTWYYGGQKVIMDHKTTAVSWPQGYLAEYELSPQLMMYKLINDMLFPDDNDGDTIGCVINGIFLAKPAVTKGTTNNKFQRSDVFTFRPAVMAAFRRRLERVVIEMAAELKKLLDNGGILSDEMFPQNFNCCSRKYGMCGYKELCKNSEFQDDIIEHSFSLRNYNPLKFQE